MTDTAKVKEETQQNNHKKGNDWLANEQGGDKKEKKAAFVKNIRECRIIIIRRVKWLLHFSFVLADRCRVPMVTAGSSCKI